MSLNVCSDQSTYNAAFRKAIQEYQKDQCSSKSCKTTLMVISIFMLIFYIWAFILAMKIKDKDQRVIHTVFALTTGPIYVIAHYAGYYNK